MKFEKGMEKKKTRGLRAEYVDACIHSFFIQVFLREILKHVIQVFIESLPDGS